MRRENLKLLPHRASAKATETEVDPRRVSQNKVLLRAEHENKGVAQETQEAVIQ